MSNILAATKESLRSHSHKMNQPNTTGEREDVSDEVFKADTPERRDQHTPEGTEVPTSQEVTLSLTKTNAMLMSLSYQEFAEARLIAQSALDRALAKHEATLKAVFEDQLAIEVPDTPINMHIRGDVCVLVWKEE